MKCKIISPFAFMAGCMVMVASASLARTVKVPGPLHQGSRIAIVTPASAQGDEIIDSAIVKITAHGYVPVVMDHAYGNAYGSYPATDEERAADLMSAFADKDIDAILCTRGGYGTVRLLPLLNKDTIYNNPKWLIGYSDISDLHAYMYHAGVASVHGPMTSHLAYEPDTIESTTYLYSLLANPLPLRYDLPPEAYNKHGEAKGRVVGGNLLCINGLAETAYDVMMPADGEDVLLFIEDVGEKIYAIERILMRMHLNGSLGRVKGLIIGQFTEYSPSKDFQTMEDMIHHWLEKWGYYDTANPMPIVYNFPVGHVSDNYPMVSGAMASLSVRPDGTTLIFTEQ